MSSFKGLHPGIHDEPDTTSEKHRRKIFHDSDDERRYTASPSLSKFKGDDRKSIGVQKEKPAELFRKDLISAMKLPDSEQLQPEEYLLIADQWKMDWEKGVQVPVNPVFHNASTKVLRKKSKTGDFKLPPRKYLHNAQDENYKQGIHELTLMQQLADQVVRYDLDEVDSCWLQRVNDERLELGDYEIQEWIMERVMEEIENQCHENMQQVIKTAEGCGIEYDENILCDVCQSPDSEDNNEMVFCDNCDICVHQACYGIQKIPEGNWLCRSCALGLKPLCILCPNMGGAMKSTKSGTKWAHVSCALWIPEVSIGCVEKMEPITKISNIPSSRWALLCTLCREKTGACIQCSVKQCKTAFHVTCAFLNNLEMKTVLDENDEDDVKLKAYCPKHTKKRGGEIESPAKTPRKDGIGPISPRKELTNEEKDDLRQRKIKQLQNEFYSCVSVKDVSTALQLDEETIDLIYEYWKLKRRVNGNKPLLTPKHEEEDLLAKQQENSLLARMKMFVQLRQDLERVRNLCYMVSRREKIRRSLYKMKEEIFYQQVEVVENERMSARELDQIIQANHASDFYDKPDYVLTLSNQFSEQCAKAESDRLKASKSKSDLFPSRSPVKNRNATPVKTPMKKEEVTIDKCDKTDGAISLTLLSPSRSKTLASDVLSPTSKSVTPTKAKAKTDQILSDKESEKVPPLKLSPGVSKPSPFKVSTVISPIQIQISPCKNVEKTPEKEELVTPVKNSPEKNTPVKVEKGSPKDSRPRKTLHSLRNNTPDKSLLKTESPNKKEIQETPIKEELDLLKTPIKGTPDKFHLSMEVSPEHDSLRFSPGGRSDAAEKSKSPKTKTVEKHRSEINKLEDFLKAGKRELTLSEIISLSPSVDEDGHRRSSRRLAILKDDNIKKTDHSPPPSDDKKHQSDSNKPPPPESKEPSSDSKEPSSDCKEPSSDGKKPSKGATSEPKPTIDVSINSVPKIPSQDVETQSTTTSLASGEEEEWIIIDSPPSGDESTRQPSPGTNGTRTVNNKLRLKSRLLRKGRSSLRKKIGINGFHKQVKLDQFLKSESAHVPVESSSGPDDVLLVPPFVPPANCTDSQSTSTVNSGSKRKTPLRPSSKSNSENVVKNSSTRGKRKVEADTESHSIERVHSSRESTPDIESRSLRPRRSDTFVNYADIKRKKRGQMQKSDVVSTDSENISVVSETVSDKSGPTLRKRTRLSDIKDDRSTMSNSSRHSFSSYPESKRLSLNMSHS